MNGDIIGFGPQTKKLELPHKTPSSIVAVKGLTEINKLIEFEGNTFKLSEGIYLRKVAQPLQTFAKFRKFANYIFVSFQQITLYLGFIASFLRSFFQRCRQVFANRFTTKVEKTVDGSKNHAPFPQPITVLLKRVFPGSTIATCFCFQFFYLYFDCLYLLFFALFLAAIFIVKLLFL